MGKVTLFREKKGEEKKKKKNWGLKDSEKLFVDSHCSYLFLLTIVKRKGVRK